MAAPTRVLALVITAALSLTACGGAFNPFTSPAAKASPTPAGPAKLVVGYSQVYQGELALWYAAAKGIFKKHDLDVDLRLTESATGAAALIAGQLNIFQGGGSEMLSAAAGGEDVVLLGNLVPVYPYVFLSSPDIKTPADLKGKKVGVSKPGSTSDIATRVALQKLNLVPDKDVTITYVGSSQNRSAALLAGAIQGGLDEPPSYFELTAKGFKVLFDMVSMQAPVVNNGIGAKRSWLKANPEVAQRYVDAVVESIAAVRKDRQGAIDVIKKELKVTDDKIASGTYDFTMKLYPAYPYPRTEHLTDAVKLLGATNAKIATFDVASMIDDSFMRNAELRGVGK